MPIHVCDTAESKISDVTKFILRDEIFGKNEVSVIRKADKTILCLPTQTNCKMGCTFCHLTGTTRPAKNLSSEWIEDVVDLLIGHCGLDTDQRDVLVSFMGVGEPLRNREALKDAMRTLADRYLRIRFGICTMGPGVPAMRDLSDWCLNNPDVRVKLHLSVHGMHNREAIVPNGMPISRTIRELRRFHEQTGHPIEYHYTLVDGVNDSIEELQDFYAEICSDSPDVTVKFLALSETAGCSATKRTNDEVQSVFPGMVVEFYDPPGRDVGSSCGMFNRELYNENSYS